MKFILLRAWCNLDIVYLRAEGLCLVLTRNPPMVPIKGQAANKAVLQNHNNNKIVD